MFRTAGENHPMMDKLSGGNIENVLGRTIMRLTKVKKGEEKVNIIFFNLEFYAFISYYNQ